MSAPTPWKLPGLGERDAHLAASLRFLMDRFADTGDPAVAKAIQHHLRLTLCQPGIHENPGLCAYYRGQLRLWRLLAEPGTEPPGGA